MGFDLEIIFQGMCTFVPERDGSKLWVLMADRSDRIGDGVPPHAAAIRFSLENLVPGTPGMGMRRLDNHDIRIPELTKNGVTLKGFDAKTNSAAPTPPADSFAWVSPLDEACAGRGLAGGGVIDPDFLKDREMLLVKHANLMAARFLFTDGTVGIKKLSSFSGQILESIFLPPDAMELGQELLQPTAAQVSLTTRIEADSVTFEATELRSNKPASPLTLRPVGGKLSVAIMNEEADSLVGLPGEPIQLPKEKRPKERPQDRIFLSMFDFCLNPPQPAERPIPIPSRVSTRFPSPPPDIILDGAPPCSPGRGVLPVS